MATRSEEIVFRPCPDYGEPHDSEFAGDVDPSFYFAIQSPEGRLSGFVSRREFNYLAGRLGLPALESVNFPPKPKPVDPLEALKAAQKRLEQIDDNSEAAIALRLQIGDALAQGVRS